MRCPVTSPSESSDLPTQRERQRAETRERLFQAAIEEFRRAGVAGARIERIAKAVGVVRGTFYFHFPTKEHVLGELQLRSQERIMEQLEALKPDMDGVPELLAAIVRGLESAGELISDGELLRDTLALYVRHPMADGVAGDEPRPITEQAAAVVASAQARGEIRSDISPDAAVALIMTSMFGVFAAGTGASRGELLHSWTTVVGRGLKPE